MPVNPSRLSFLPNARVRPRDFAFPGPRDRVAISGSTGSGKSTFAFWLFSECADFNRKPWVIVDYKGEDIADEMLRVKDAHVVNVRDDVPTKPGIYVVKPEAATEQGLVVAWLWQVYKRGQCGLIFDEVTMVPEMRGEMNSGGPLKSILTQGRSKEIPVYALTQRPVDINKHIFTEAQYISAFRLKLRDDRKRVLDYIPDDDAIWRGFAENTNTLPNHWSRWRDDRRDISFILKPCPPASHILDTIATRVYHMRRHSSL